MGVPVLTHQPVLLNEVLDSLDIRSDGRYLDATFGRGGHTAAILERLGEHGGVVAIDRDPTAIAVGRERFANDARVQLVHGAFGQVLAANEVSGEFDGVLFDLGVSSPQLDDASRGFSFMQNGPLDMRMDNSKGVTAQAWLEKVSERDLQRVISEYGEERFARRIAQAIVTRRREQTIATTAELAQLVSEVVPTREPGKHPATRTFQAIRMAVNAELEQIDQALNQVIGLLKAGGRLCVISFHSLEDQRVKRFMQQHSQDDPMYAGLPNIPADKRAKLKRIGRAIHASEMEVASNPRARSAIMRVAERVVA